jgi:hypothetical protein
MRMGGAATGGMVGRCGVMLVGVMRRLMIKLVGLMRVMRLVGLVLRWTGGLIGKLVGMGRLSELGGLMGLIGRLLRVKRLIEGIGMGERVVVRKSRRRRSVNGVTTPGELMEGYIGVRVTIRGKVRVGVGGERGNIRVRVRG